MIVQKYLIRSTIGRKGGILGELDNVQLKPSKNLMKPKDVAQEVVQEPAPKTAIEDLPAPTLEGKPRFYT
jgi:hypothetical protein